MLHISFANNLKIFPLYSSTPGQKKKKKKSLLFSLYFQKAANFLNEEKEKKKFLKIALHAVL